MGLVHVGLWMKAKTAGTSQFQTSRKHRLQMLTFIFVNTGIRKPTNGRMFP